MTVRITKPEFNLRDKLSELEFFKLPYHKIPDGSVCQRKFHYAPSSGGAENETTNTSFVDASYYQPYFTPRFIDSVIMIEWTTNIKRNINIQMQLGRQGINRPKKKPGKQSTSSVRKG